jgi:arsenate reductase (thioredoxin)
MSDMAWSAHDRALGPFRPSRRGGIEAERRLAFADTLRMLNNRSTAFVNLPIASLDKLTLQNRLRTIGRDSQ